MWKARVLAACLVVLAATGCDRRASAPAPGAPAVAKADPLESHRKALARDLAAVSLDPVPRPVPLPGVIVSDADGTSGYEQFLDACEVRDPKDPAADSRLAALAALRAHQGVDPAKEAAHQRGGPLPVGCEAFASVAEDDPVRPHLTPPLCAHIARCGGAWSALQAGVNAKRRRSPLHVLSARETGGSGSYRAMVRAPQALTLWAWLRRGESPQLRVDVALALLTLGHDAQHKVDRLRRFTATASIVAATRTLRGVLLESDLDPATASRIARWLTLSVRSRAPFWDALEVEDLQVRAALTTWAGSPAIAPHSSKAILGLKAGPEALLAYFAFRDANWKAWTAVRDAPAGEYLAAVRKLDAVLAGAELAVVREVHDPRRRYLRYAGSDLLHRDWVCMLALAAADRAQRGRTGAWAASLEELDPEVVAVCGRQALVNAPFALSVAEGRRTILMTPGAALMAEIGDKDPAHFHRFTHPKLSR